MKLIMLPGMDGTGMLFEPLRESLGSEWDVEVINYPSNGPQDYETLKRHAQSRLPQNEDYVLLGESFSGPIAYSIGLGAPRGLKAIVLVATFLEPPRPTLLRLVKALFRMVGGLRPPNNLVRRLLLGHDSKQSLVERFKDVLQMVPKSTIVGRFESVATLHPPKAAVKVPLAYIQALQDKLVPNECIEGFRVLNPDLREYKINGPHFLLQTRVSECIEVLKKEKALLTQH
jgi:pimeloyl-[acyl-carrier protein] methyl ester esterase